jgi:Zn-dependent peptidase ImmA (M78 family)
VFLEEFHEERTLPVPIEEIVEFDFEIEIVPLEGILDDLEVDAFLTSDLKQIFVDAFVMNHRHRRFRFSLAHELAHHELHRPLYQGSRISSVRDWQTIQDSISEDDYAWFEFQANSFAGLVLVPAAELADQYRVAVRAAQEAGLSEETLSSDAGKSHLARWLADQFEVSELAMEKRMEKDGLWSPPAPPPTSGRIARRKRQDLD